MPGVWARDFIWKQSLAMPVAEMRSYRRGVPLTHCDRCAQRGGRCGDDMALAQVTTTPWAEPRRTWGPQRLGGHRALPEASEAVPSFYHRNLGPLTSRAMGE